MNKIINNLLKNANSNNDDINTRAASQIGAILEINTNPVVAKNDTLLKEYAWLLTSDMIELKLSIQDQQIIVDEIIKMIKLRRGNAYALLDSLGKANYEICIEPLLKLLIEKADELGEANLRSALIALVHLVDDDMSSVAINTFYKYNPITLLSKLACSDDYILSKQATYLLKTLSDINWAVNLFVTNP